jgi:proteic killer suppression protein
MAQQYGDKMAGKLKQRLMELRAADSLSDISHLPPPRLHELKNRNGVFSVDLDEKQRLLFVPANNPIPTLDGGGIDKARVTEIEITGIEDTHDRKNQRRGGK